VVGAPGSFEDFYRAEVAGVLAVTMALTKRRSEAEDVTQEAFLRAWRDWASVGRMAYAGAWVRRVALNLAVSRWRRMGREAVAVLSLRREPASLDPGHDPQLWAAVRSLSERQAQVVALTYVEDLDHNAVGRILGIAPSTVRVHLVDARKRLGEMLGDAP
jgi:RNA polymerase sigma-70 factor (ECF subfamily)